MMVIFCFLITIVPIILLMVLIISMALLMAIILPMVLLIVTHAAKSGDLMRCKPYPKKL